MGKKRKPRRAKPGELPRAKFVGVSFRGWTVSKLLQSVSVPSALPRLPDRWIVIRRGQRYYLAAPDRSVELIVAVECRCGHGKGTTDECRKPIGVVLADLKSERLSFYWSGYGPDRYVDAPAVRHERIAPGDLLSGLQHIYPSTNPLALEAYCPDHGPRSIDRQLPVDEAKRKTRSGTPKVFRMEPAIRV